MESWLVAQLAQIYAVNAEIQGMIALNQYRLARDETIAYDEENFQMKANELQALSNTILHYG